MKTFSPIESVIEDIRQGKMIILVDDDRREQEGDLVIAAEKITPEDIVFMSKQASGVICLTITEERVEKLRIPLMLERHRHPNQAAFTVSIEAVSGVTTGASAHDRVKTIQTVIDPASTHEDISMPGHVFPLRARAGGVLERPGHTEGSVDLMRLAGLTPAAVICEIMNPDGTMARFDQLQTFAKQHDIKIVSIQDLIDYRLRTENLIEEVSSAPLPLEYSPHFTIKVFQHPFIAAESVALIHGDINFEEPVLVRLHSECLTGDAFGSRRCDCGWQLEQSLKLLAKHNGILIYLRHHEGRGIGLGNKIKAYQLQSKGLDTVEANHQLGFLADYRHYGLCAQMLRHMKVKQIRLLTNNPKKMTDLEKLGITVTERVSLEMQPTQDNAHYLQAKRDRLGHLLTLQA